MARHNPGTRGVVVGFAGLTTVLVALPTLNARELAHLPPPVGGAPLAAVSPSALAAHALNALSPYAVLFLILVLVYSAVLRCLDGFSVMRAGAAKPLPRQRPRSDDHLRLRPSYKAAADRRAEARHETARTRRAREADDVRLGHEALSLRLATSGDRHVMGVRVPTAIGGMPADAIALVGTTVVVMSVLHLQGTITGAGLGERWEHEPRQNDRQTLPNPVSHLMRVVAAVRTIVGDTIAVQRLVVLTGPAKAVSCGREVVRLAALGTTLDRMAREDGGVDGATARNRFAYLARAMGR